MERTVVIGFSSLGWEIEPCGLHWALHQLKTGGIYEGWHGRVNTDTWSVRFCIEGFRESVALKELKGPHEPRSVEW